MKSRPLFDKYELHPLRLQDASAIFHTIDTQREYLGRWLPFVATTHQEEQTRSVVANMLDDIKNPIFTIYDRDTFVGLIGFKSANETTLSIEIGYWLREEYQGKGIMTTAVQALCDIAFGELKMKNIRIQCGVGNLRSNCIPQRLGFRFDRMITGGEQLSDGKFIDLNVYLLTN